MPKAVEMVDSKWFSAEAPAQAGHGGLQVASTI